MTAPMLPYIISSPRDGMFVRNMWLLEFDAATYHADLSAISQGALKWIERSPAHFIQNYGKKIGSSPDMRLGTLLHMALLEPHQYAKQILQPAFGDLRFKGPKAAKAEWIETLNVAYVVIDDDGKRTGLAPDAPVMTPIEKQHVEGMAASVLSNRLLASLMRDALLEATTYWVDPDTSLLRRARLDIVSPSGIVLDLKTTDSAMREEFARRIHQNDYDFQAASYLEAANAVILDAYRDYGIVAIERDPPYGNKFFMLKPRALARGASRVSAALRTLKTCIQSGAWPGYPEAAEEIDLPEYAYASGRMGDF